MKASAIAPALVALVLSACGSQDRTPRASTATDVQAAAVADALRDTDGVAEVTADGGAVTAIIDAPLPAAGLDDATRARIAEATKATFTASLCERSGLDAFFTAGGTLVLVVRGSDGGAVAEVPITACV